MDNYTATAISNMALSHLAISTEIADVDVDKSKEALACRRFYAQIRDEVLRDFPWPFATQTVALAQLAVAPTNEWGFSYQMPADCVHFRRILNGMSRFETLDTRIPYRIVTNRVIFTDQDAAIGEYTMRVTDVSQYPSDFIEAVSLLLARAVAPRLTGGDQFKLGAAALEFYQYKIAVAKDNATREEQPDRDNDSDYITVRE